jgi:mono/diheme cytochrome c family protein
MKLWTAAIAAPVFLMMASVAANAEDVPADGEALFEAACAECHRNAARVAGRVTGTEDERRERLEVFLEDHYAPDADERQAIIDYLVGL